MASLRKAGFGLIVLGAFGWSAISASAATLDEAAAKFLGDIADIVAAADRVESVQLEAKTDMIEPSVQGYAVREKGPDLSVGQVETLRTLIFSEASYVFDKSKRCPFLADSGFVFHAGAREASVVLSQSCKLWSFARAGERPRIEDYDPAESEIKALLAELFAKP